MSIKKILARRKIGCSAFLVCIVFGLFLGIHYLASPRAYGAQLGDRSLQLSDDSISASTNYQLTFHTSTLGEIGSILIQFCSNDAIIGDTCTPPVGFSDSNAVLASQVGVTGFTISPSSTINTLILTRTSQVAGITGAQYTFTGVINPSVPGSYYMRIQTFATSDAQGQASDYGGDAFAIANNVAISAEVPPYLIFCTGVTIPGLSCDNASGDYIDVGELSNTQASTASSQMLIATNAGNGYSVTVYGTTMSSGNNFIPGLNNNDVSRPGVGQFGFNLRANNTPPNGSNPSGPGTGEPTADYNIPNSYRFDNGDTIISNDTSDNLREYTASYLVNVPNTQQPGIYVTTLTYIAVATF